MKLYIKQKVFSIGDKFTVMDESGEPVFTVQGEVFSFGRKLHVYDLTGNELLFIQQKLLSFLPKYFIYKNGTQTAEVRGKFSLKPTYEVVGPDWTVVGTFTEHDYNITRGGFSVASIHQKWMSWGDTYEIDIAESVDTLTVLGVVLVIDCIKAAQAEAASSSSSV